MNNFIDDITKLSFDSHNPIQDLRNKIQLIYNDFKDLGHDKSNEVDEIGGELYKASQIDNLDVRKEIYYECKNKIIAILIDA